MSWVNVFGQNFFKDPITKGRFNYIIGYQNINPINLEGLNILELGIARGFREVCSGGGMDCLWYSNYHLSSEIIFNNPNPCTGLKLGYTFSFIFLNLGIQIVDYTNFKQSDFAIRPEIGFTLIGIYEIIYGYNSFLDNNDFQNIGNNTLSLRWTINSMPNK